MVVAGPAIAGVPNYDSFCDVEGHIGTPEQVLAAQDMVRAPGQVEAVFADAGKGNRRAARVFQELETRFFPDIGRAVAEQEHSLKCQTPVVKEFSEDCRPHWEFLGFLPETEAGARLFKAAGRRRLCRQSRAVVQGQQSEGLHPEWPGGRVGRNWSADELDQRLSDQDGFRARNPSEPTMTIRDITMLLERSESQAAQWSTADMLKVVELARDLLKGDSSIDWDPGVPEEWARLFVDRRLVLAVNCVTPVAIVVTPADTQLLTLLDELGVIPITTPDWDRPEFSANPEVIQRVFRRSWWSDAIDPGAFSANDLWWMTVT